ncbi:Scr1 family TA system antitoxin-like transcriptional regulator [Streptosporangium sp. NBC_01469]|uniref:Scr1 family TA system antitoxin-like transcriptional regulator n=1 Tax=Streptosporangium sp. NBC_01469 TaxID=2903898 RepID=UPI003FCCF597
MGAGGEIHNLWTHVTRAASPQWFRGRLDVEQQAHALHTWEPLVVPGLLQTEEYARGLVDCDLAGSCGGRFEPRGFPGGDR